MLFSSASLLSPALLLAVPTTVLRPFVRCGLHHMPPCDVVLPFPLVGPVPVLLLRVALPPLPFSLSGGVVAACVLDQMVRLPPHYSKQLLARDNAPCRKGICRGQGRQRRRQTASRIQAEQMGKAVNKSSVPYII